MNDANCLGAVIRASYRTPSIYLGEERCKKELRGDGSVELLIFIRHAYVLTVIRETRLCHAIPNVLVVRGELLVPFIFSTGEKIDSPVLLYPAVRRTLIAGDDCAI